MKRIEGRVNRERDVYEVVSPDGHVMKEVPLGEVDSKLRSAIERNSWESL